MSSNRGNNKQNIGMATDEEISTQKKSAGVSLYGTKKFKILHPSTKLSPTKSQT